MIYSRALAPLLIASLPFFTVTLHAEDKVPSAMKIPVASTSTPTDTTNKKVQNSPHADNTERNTIHDGKNAVTADQQSNSESDVEITRKIRQAIMKDKDLSTYAHNIKIITVNGSVVLKGPVRNNEEKLQVEERAFNVAGKEKVVSEIEVKAK